MITLLVMASVFTLAAVGSDVIEPRWQAWRTRRADVRHVRALGRRWTR